MSLAIPFLVLSFFKYFFLFFYVINLPREENNFFKVRTITYSTTKKVEQINIK